MLELHGWRFFETKKKKERKNNCWIDPEGRWYSVDVCNHEMFAYAVFKEFNPRPKDVPVHTVTDDFQNAGKWLLDHGWLYIESTFMSGTIIRGYAHMNEKQYRILLAHFKNQMLFRGWTIRGLWLLKEKEAKEQAKLD
jgi:hypothetical protein